MAFDYAISLAQQTPTSGTKQFLLKSFEIDISKGSGFLSGTAYRIGWLPKEGQLLGYYLNTTTAVSGGTVSAATLQVQVGGSTITGAVNVFGLNSIQGTATTIYMTNKPYANGDQSIVYTPTLTGAGATTGVIYLTLFYVV